MATRGYIWIFLSALIAYSCAGDQQQGQDQEVENQEQDQEYQDDQNYQNGQEDQDGQGDENGQDGNSYEDGQNGYGNQQGGGQQQGYANQQQQGYNGQQQQGYNGQQQAYAGGGNGNQAYGQNSLQQPLAEEGEQLNNATGDEFAQEQIPLDQQPAVDASADASAGGLPEGAAPVAAPRPGGKVMYVTRDINLFVTPGGAVAGSLERGDHPLIWTADSIAAAGALSSGLNAQGQVPLQQVSSGQGVMAIQEQGADMPGQAAPANGVQNVSANAQSNYGNGNGLGEY